MRATALSLRLIPIACQSSYPLNSENANPPGTFALYLSWPATTRLTKTPTRSIAVDSCFFICSSPLCRPQHPGTFAQSIDRKLCGLPSGEHFHQCLGCSGRGG